MNQRPILKNKYYLYLTEFFAGVSVMAVELGASRLLAPYFSSSQIVWTVIIGVIMIAMALGNVWGGRIADKNPSPDKLYGRLLLAAVWIALIPFVGRYLIAGISLLLAVFITKNFLVWAALFACLAVFAFPCILLGTVTPSLVKYSVNSLEDNGKTVGELGALNTIGSIIGTFLPTFVTIPAVGTAITFLIFSGVLAAISILYFLSIRKKLAACALAVCLILALGFTSSSFRFAFWENDITLEDESIYNYLQVQETDRSVILSTNVLFGVQSILMKNAKLTGMYYDYALAAPFLAGLPQKDSSGSILVLGLGTGTFAKYCSEYFKDASIEGVEIDEKIAKLATEYFDLPESVNVSVYDGRSYLAASEKKYDVIFVGADKGRGESLLKLQKRMEQMGLKTKFIITADGRFSRHKWYYSKGIEYSQIISLDNQSKALLNITMPHQKGITMRDFESVFNKVKLITNNTHIINFDFYRKENVFILGKDDWKDLPFFLNTPFHEIDNNILEKYLFEKVVDEMTCGGL